jgi:large subunit ribosomal protein L16
MKQFPNRTKFKKYHLPKASFLHLHEQKVFFPAYGNFALKSLDAARLTFKQIEAGRKSIRRSVQKAGILSIRVFPYAPLTKKPNSRMGKGKGAHDIWVCPIKAGQIVYELGGLSANKSRMALFKAGHKLPVRTSVISLIY